MPAFAGLNSWSQQLCSGHPTCPGTPQFQLILSGPFGLVLHNAPNVTGITAFMPADLRHGFALERQIQNGNDFQFQLIQDTPSNALCIEDAFQDFCVEKTTWVQNPQHIGVFLKMELAVPMRIKATQEPHLQPLSVTLKNSTTPKWMHRVYILEYDTPVQLIETKSGLTLPQRSSYTFEVGLPHGNGDTPTNDHALQFYNQSLLAFFPEWQQDQTHLLQTLSETQMAKAPPSKKGSPAARPQEESSTTTTFECKAGGLIVGN